MWLCSPGINKPSFDFFFSWSKHVQRCQNGGIWPHRAVVLSERLFSIIISLPGEQHLCVTTNSCIYPALCQELVADSEQMEPEGILRNRAFRKKKKKPQTHPTVCGYKYMDLLAISGNRPVPIDSRRYPHLNKHRVLHAALSRGVCLGGDFSHFSHAGIILRQARAANRGPQSKLVSCPE